MNNLHRLVTVTGIIFGLFSLSGCSSMFPVQSYVLQTAQGNPAAAVSRDVALYEYGRPLSQSYTVLGKVMTFKRVAWERYVNWMCAHRHPKNFSTP